MDADALARVAVAVRFEAQPPEPRGATVAGYVPAGLAAAGRRRSTLARSTRATQGCTASAEQRSGGGLLMTGVMPLDDVTVIGLT